jgi:hypothetical protein
LSRRSRNECSSAPLCSMSRWRAPVTCSEGHPNRDRRLPVDVAQGRLPYAMPVAASFPDAPRRLPWGCIWVSSARAAPRAYCVAAAGC